MLPELVVNNKQQTPKAGKSFLFDFDTGEFVLIDGRLVPLEGLEAVKQWVKCTLKTERFKYLLYQDYGVEIEDLVSNQLPYNLFISEVERTIKEALGANENIQSVTNFSFNREGSFLRTKFNVTLVDGLSFGGEHLV